MVINIYAVSKASKAVSPHTGYLLGILMPPAHFAKPQHICSKRRPTSLAPL